MANYSPMACTVGANIAILKVIGGENVVSNLPQHTKKKQVKGKCKVAIWQKYLVFQPSEDISIGMDNVIKMLHDKGLTVDEISLPVDPLQTL